MKGKSRRRKVALSATWQPGQPVVIKFADGSTRVYPAGQPGPVEQAIYQAWRAAARKELKP